MKNAMIRFFVVCSVFGFIKSADAQEACQDLFSSPALELGVRYYPVAEKITAVETAAWTMEILRKASYGRAGQFNEKQVVEKGEMILAEPLRDGYSVEFEYSRDHRGPEPVWRLEEVELIKPNGDSVTLDKAPVTDDGNGFKKDIYALDQIAPLLGENKVEMPVKIEGPILESINKWARFAEFIKLGEIRALKTSMDLKSLRGKVFVRSTIDYTNKVIKKQSFKFFLLGMVMYLYSQRDKITKETILVDPWDKFKRQSDLAMSNPAMHALMQTQLQMLTGEKYVIPDSTSRDHFRYFDFRDTLEKIDIMNKLERAAGSKMKGALFMNGKFSGMMAMKDIHMDSVDVLEEADAIVLYFPKTERMLVLSGSWMKFEISSDLIVPYALSWNGGIDGTIYNKLKEKFKALKKDF